MDGDRAILPEQAPPETSQTGEPRDDAQASGEAQREGRAWSSDHPVNIRLSLPLGIGRYYVTIVAGRERRSASRRASERRRHPLATLGNMAVLFVLGTVCGLAGLALFQLVSAYVLERAGIMVVN